MKSKEVLDNYICEFILKRLLEDTGRSLVKYVRLSSVCGSKYSLFCEGWRAAMKDSLKNWTSKEKLGKWLGMHVH